jgi:hypothetical protein
MKIFAIRLRINFVACQNQKSSTLPRPAMDRSKIIAILTGAIALLLGFAYLVIVQLLDLRGEMIPAPQDLSMIQALF